MYDEERQALNEFMKKAKKSQKQVSKEMGLSTAVISQFLNNSYTGDNQVVAKAINQYLAVGKQRLNSVLTAQFYKELYNTKEALFAVNYAHKRCDIVLVSGDSGAGKTTALKYYAENNVGVIFVTANSCTSSASAILSLICAKLKLQISNKRNELMKTLTTFLTGSKRLIIIDEADHLTLNALQAVRNLNDDAGVGIVLSGNDKIYRQMLTSKKGYEFDQIRNRIIVRKRVINEYTVEEIKSIFVGLDDECTAYLLAIANNESLRTARKLFEIALEYANLKQQSLSFNVLKETQVEMMGEYYG